jgi:predicted AAA+ superfamily ATPase
MIIIHAMNTDEYRPRLLQPTLERALAAFPVVVVTGARQTGKSTLVRQEGGEPAPRPYLTLDDLDVLAQAREEPDALVARAARLTLDEVQRAPDLLLAVKRAVDQRRTAGRFVLTGSANLLLMRAVSESLAGRAAYLALWPMTRREQAGLGRAGLWSELLAADDADWPDVLAANDAGPADWRELARRGGYPTPALQLDSAGARAAWFAGYARTYLERDLQELSSISALPDFRRLMRAACLRLGQLVNQTELGRDVGLPQPTVLRYLNLLETSYELVRLQAYSVNRSKRLIRTPKLYWCDTGLALHLAGQEAPGGPHLENLVLSDLQAWRDSQLETPEVLYWRTATGEEVDFVVESAGRLLPIEVKATTRPRVADARHLRSFRAEYPDIARAGLLLHVGEETSWIAPGVLATPWWRVL